MTRSLWKGPFSEALKHCPGYAGAKLNYCAQNKKNSLSDPVPRSVNNHKTKSFVWSRRSMVLPEFCGYQFHIYNGKKFIICRVIEDMIGHKLGEFASTRQKPSHKHKNYP
ncbi:ribosomal protein S19 (mitochondrion) [Bryopsis sp. KO-2023]|nr:ribosomal protein S19 [Bryopsis sp. KO-2023]